MTNCWFGWLETTDWPVFWTVTCGVTEGDATWFGMGASTFVCTGGVFGDWLGILFFCFNNFFSLRLSFLDFPWTVAICSVVAWTLGWLLFSLISTLAYF